MMARLRYRAMYATSVAIGYVLAGVMFISGARWQHPVGMLVRRTAERHAEAAADKQGPYLAPVTFLIGLLGLVTCVVLLSGCKPAPGCGAACVPNPGGSAAAR